MTLSIELQRQIRPWLDRIAHYYEENPSAQNSRFQPTAPEDFGAPPPYTLHQNEQRERESSRPPPTGLTFLDGLRLSSLPSNRVTAIHVHNAPIERPAPQESVEKSNKVLCVFAALAGAAVTAIGMGYLVARNEDFCKPAQQLTQTEALKKSIGKQDETCVDLKSLIAVQCMIDQREASYSRNYFWSIVTFSIGGATLTAGALFDLPVLMFIGTVVSVAALIFGWSYWTFNKKEEKITQLSLENRELFQRVNALFSRQTSEDVFGGGPQNRPFSYGSESRFGGLDRSSRFAKQGI